MDRQRGPVNLGYTLVDAFAYPADAVVEFSTDGGVTFAPCSPTGTSDPLSARATAPDAGRAHRFVWDSRKDLPKPQTFTGPDSVRIRYRVTSLPPAGIAARLAQVIVPVEVNNEDAPPALIVPASIPRGEMRSGQLAPLCLQPGLSAGSAQRLRSQPFKPPRICDE